MIVSKARVMIFKKISNLNMLLLFFSSHPMNYNYTPILPHRYHSIVPGYVSPAFHSLGTQYSFLSTHLNVWSIISIFSYASQTPIENLFRNLLQIGWIKGFSCFINLFMTDGWRAQWSATLLQKTFLSQLLTSSGTKMMRVIQYCWFGCFVARRVWSDPFRIKSSNLVEKLGPYTAF